jgi:hypothetical protein
MVFMCNDNQSRLNVARLMSWPIVEREEGKEKIVAGRGLSASSYLIKGPGWQIRSAPTHTGRGGSVSHRVSRLD